MLIVCHTLLWALSKYELTHSSQSPYEVGPVNNPFYRRENLETDQENCQMSQARS